MDQLELEIAEWRAYLDRSPSLNGRDVEELEAHLRDQIDDLAAAGLASDEAFLIAVKRIGAIEDVSHEFAREHSGRLWKQLVLAGDDHDQTTNLGWLLPFLLAVAAAVTVQIARFAAGFPGEVSSWLLRNAALFVLPFLAGYFAHRRQLTPRQWLVMAAPFVISALVVNLYPFAPEGSTHFLVAAHLPAALWFVVAYPYVGGALRSHERRMDFVRFTGEWSIYFALLALGGGVLLGVTAAVLAPAGVDTEQIVEWVLPMGAAGAVIVAAWLVESKQRVVENMAPVLTMVFTPLFAVMLIVSAIVYAFTGLGGAFDRELLGVFDLLMVVVLGLVLYGISARDPEQEPGWMDRIQLVAVVAALALDSMVLGAMMARIGDLGFTPNRAAAMGLNIVLLINLAGTAWLSARFLARRGTFHQLVRWQTAYLPVFALWAAAVVILLPPLFSFA